MQVRLTGVMLTALREAPEIPDNLLARMDGAKRDGDGFVVTLNEDEAMALTEMCQWYVRTDPASGRLGEKARVFEAIVNAIDGAEN